MQYAKFIKEIRNPKKKRRKENKNGKLDPEETIRPSNKISPWPICPFPNRYP
jgi:hypothetical protein